MKDRHRRRRMDPHTVLIIRQVLIGVMICSFISLLVLSVWYGSRVDMLTISEVTVSGGETISHDEVREKVWGQLGGAYLGLVPRVFAWTYPEKKIRAAVEEVDRIRDVRVYRDGGRKLEVTFGEYVPDSLWCDLDEHPYCYFLDEHGYAFSEAPTLHGGAFVRFTTVGGEPKLKETFVSTETYQALKKLLLLLNDAGWYASRIDVDAAGDIYVHIVGGGELKATLKQTPTETVNNLAVVLNSEEFTHIKPGNFKYIDLRFGNKVFVNEVLTDASEEMATTTESILPINPEPTAPAIPTATATESANMVTGETLNLEE